MPHVVITGASRGIGRELVLQYVAAGWTITAGCGIRMSVSYPRR